MEQVTEKILPHRHLCPLAGQVRHLALAWRRQGSCRLNLMLTVCAASLQPGLAVSNLIFMCPFACFRTQSGLDEPPLDLLSDRELEAMEGQEREKLMRRIEFLRQFRQELDAMLARFGQYEQLANR